MTFLKKIGLFIAQAVPRAIEFFPFLAPFGALFGGAKGSQIVQTVGNDLRAMSNIVVSVEAIYAATHDPSVKTGADKLKAAIPMFKTLIQNSELMVGKNVQNEQLFEQAITEYAQATVDLLNSIEPPSDPNKQ